MMEMELRARLALRDVSGGDKGQHFARSGEQILVLVGSSSGRCYQLS